MPSMRIETSDPEYSDDETTPLAHDIYGSTKSGASDSKAWDVFRHLPPETESETLEDQTVYLFIIKSLKVLAYILTFIIVLGGAVLSKGTVLLMTSQLEPDRKLPFCNKNYGRDKTLEARTTEEERIGWTWALLFCYLVPEIGTFIRSLRICVFKAWHKPRTMEFLVPFFFETCHAFGLSLFIFAILPSLDVVKAAMLTNCVCLIPAIFGMLSRSPNEDGRPKWLLKCSIDSVAILFQISALVLWPLFSSEHSLKPWLLPLAAVLISCGWWENYVSDQSPFGPIKYLGKMRKRIQETRYFTYVFISIWKMLVFFSGMMLGIYITGGIPLSSIFKRFSSGFRHHQINITEVGAPIKLTDNPDSPDSILQEIFSEDAQTNAVFHAILIQIVSSYICYIFGKFACKICIQGFSFAFPVSLAVPVTISLLISFCGLRADNPCFWDSILPRYLYWNCPRGDFVNDFINKEYSWAWLLWLLSQSWIALHIWTPKCERLASTERLFVCPMYNSMLVDQSLAFNRRRDDDNDIRTDEVETEIETDYEEIRSVDSSQKENRNRADTIPKIFACATMWHETREEMMEMLKSLFRMDEDQCARRVALKFFDVVDPGYYEFETHIFFDDAFELSDDRDLYSPMIVNPFVKKLVTTLEEAACHVHETQVRLRPPKKIPTPYGGRLEWLLPGKTKLIAHLKDKSKIRHRKRWSQVMYMYYLLGHKLVELPIPVQRKEVIAENTYLLTLDGDIDFHPNAVELLVDLMKKNKNLGAACGRIHPIGTGPMVWYQKFEYAIGHWLQKATEHMIGCVLCSPGCFSLFRGKALMDDNVMAKYTTKSDEPRHYVQYDQGEDRWLCTLLLQRGYRVEYSAASDAKTHCPEGFNEFYNQRRRWVPSTMANIMDLLGDYKRTIKINPDISLPYVIYQFMLMAGTILGPGTIFLMLVGAFVAAFKIDNWTSFYWNIIPIVVFIIICFCFKSNIQLLVAQILSTLYALVMMAVLVGTALQLGEDGIGSPSAIFLIALTGSFLIAACLHPQEFWCIVPGLLYLLAIPSMYLLLIIYSLINLNNVTWGTRETVVKKTKQLFFAGLLSAVYALVMIAVLVGIFLQVSEDGIMAPSTLFLVSVAISFVIAGLVHPMEFGCLPHGIVYYITIPSMYLLLIIYSLFNMDNVTWGTREVTTRKTKQELEQEAKEQEDQKKRAKKSGFLGFLPSKDGGDDTEGSLEFSFAGLFKIMCCTSPKPVDERQQLLRIADSLERVSKRLDTIERNIDVKSDHPRRRSSNATSNTVVTSGNTRRTVDQELLSTLDEGQNEGESQVNDEESSTSSADTREKRDDLMNPFWIEDKELKRGEVDFLVGAEIVFWKDLIEKYLKPIDADKGKEAKIAEELKELRNKSVFAFFMFNALFVIIVFLLQLNKDELHVDWPFGVKTNITYNPDSSELVISKEYLQLEPIGLVFVGFFALILIIQFMAMLFHRFGTLSHILAATEMSCSRTEIETATKDSSFHRDGVRLIRRFQKLKNFDGDSDNGRNMGPQDVARRKTLVQIEKQKNSRKQVGTLDVAFERKFKELMNSPEKQTKLFGGENFHVAFEALKERRSTVLERRNSERNPNPRGKNGGMDTLKGPSLLVPPNNNNGGMPNQQPRTRGKAPKPRISNFDFGNNNIGSLNQGYESDDIQLADRRRNSQNWQDIDPENGHYGGGHYDDTNPRRNSQI